MLSTTEKTVSLAGVFGLSLESGKTYDLKLPGTLDESSIGAEEHSSAPSRETEPEALSFLENDYFEELDFSFANEEEKAAPESYVRKYRLNGEVRVFRMISYRETPGKRLFLDCERARLVRLFIDGKEVKPFMIPTLISPWVFEVTGLLDGDHMLTFLLSNDYKGLPKEEILKSNTASEETQTNWNGILGYFRLREEERTFISGVRILKREGLTADIEVEAASLTERDAGLHIFSDALPEPYRCTIHLVKGRKRFLMERVPLKEDIILWSEKTPMLYEFTFSLNGSVKKETTGFRDIGTDYAGRLIINGDRVFLRGETEFFSCPEHGYVPTDKESWRKRYLTFKSYGVNFIRFMSHCPPEAAFEVADEMGMYLLAELSQADCTAFGSDKACRYYENELRALIRTCACHPSLLMVSFGDRLVYDASALFVGRAFIHGARELDPTRLYALGSCSDFGQPEYTQDEGDIFLGEIRDETIIDPRIPVLKLDAGQHEMLPDFKEIDHFSGLLTPVNLLNKRKKAEEKGLLGRWNRYLEGCGENTLFSLVRDVQEAYLDASLSGIVFMALHDYPARGGHFAGLMNSHLIPKTGSFSDPRRFSEVFSDVAPLIVVPQHCYEYGETLEAELFIVNYSGAEVTEKLSCEITGEDFHISGAFPEKAYPSGQATLAARIKAELRATYDTDPEEPLDLEFPQELKIQVKFGKYRNQVPVYVYPSLIPLCPDDVMEAKSYTEEVRQHLISGGTVFLTPPADQEALPSSVPGRFSVKGDRSHKDDDITFGMCIEENHPIFGAFPTQAFADLRWEAMAASRAVELNGMAKSLITEIDNTQRFRNLSRLFEARVLSGNLLFSSLGLKEKIRRPEVRALLQSIYDYLGSYDFSPVQEISEQELLSLFEAPSEGGDDRG